MSEHGYQKGTPIAERLGIFQGRLVPSSDGNLQSSPGSRWSEEFVIAGRLGFAHVELLAERVRDSTNPIWSPGGLTAIRLSAAHAGLRLVSMCTEEPLDVSLADVGFVNDLAERLASVAGELALDVVVLPMEEASSLERIEWSAAAVSVDVLASALERSGTCLAIELALPARDALRFLKMSTRPTVGLCYDIGNSTAAGHQPGVEIPLLGSRILHVHAKDKDAEGTNVRFGDGEVDFVAAFDALYALGYDGSVTIEATRGDDPVATAARHRAFLLAVDPRH